MHTTRVETDNAEATIQHHGDWSGMARITWEYYPDGADDVQRGEAEVPGRLLKAIGERCAKESLKSEIIRFAEQL